MRGRLDLRGYFALAVIAGLALPTTRPMLLDLAAARVHAATHGAAPAGRAGEPGVTCRMLPPAIREQESGGRYGIVHAPTPHGRALGAYGVLPGHLSGPGSWARLTVGRDVSGAEFLGSPALQDRIAGEQLARMCAAHGPRGAAAQWFSGRWWLHRDRTPRGGGAASVAAYVDSVMALARRGGGR